MSIKKKEVELLCSRCRVEGTHVLVYSENILIRAECRSCGREVLFCEESLLTIYAKEMVGRILTKPKRMSRELQMDLRHAVHSLPLRIASKPRRMVTEVKEIVNEEKHTSKKK